MNMIDLFLKLSPHTIVLTSMDTDHLDIYSNKETLQIFL